MPQNQTLLEYLQQPLPGFTNISIKGGRSTTSTEYQVTDIKKPTGVWKDFNVASIQREYGQWLTAVTLERNPRPNSPVRDVCNEEGVQTRIIELVYHRVRRSLRATFAFARAYGSMTGKTEVTLDTGANAISKKRFAPDISFTVVGPKVGTMPNRAPGEIKPSNRWSMQLRGKHDEEFYQPFAQVNYYMVQNSARYGYILTDKEMIAFRRLDEDGTLELAKEISFTQGGSSNNPQMTVVLALWYLGILCSQDVTTGSRLSWKLTDDLV